MLHDYRLLGFNFEVERSGNATDSIAHETVTVTLKNDFDLEDTLTGVDTKMNIHLKSVKTSRKDRDRIPLEFTTIRGNNIRYITLPEELVFDALLVDNTPKRERTDTTSAGSRGAWSRR